jgi:NadR type nicotinamide-nucleotide adenylyltransferase
MIGTDISIVRGIEGRRIGHGLVFGKFMPPTNGHLYLINFARNSCAKLTIVVCSLPAEPIPGRLRYQWMKEIFPDCDVVHLDEAMPQEPSHAGDRPFFQLWGDTLRRYCSGATFDALFASESYGYRMADIMNIKFIPVDTAREMVGTSGTAVRENPFLHWDKLPPVVRPYFLKRVVILGSPSAEKNLFIKRLAEYFNTSYVADYRETLLDDFARNIPAYNAAPLTLADISTIARSQSASEEALAGEANKVLFISSELKSIAGLSGRLFGTCPDWIAAEAGKINYDLYLIVGSDDTCWWTEGGSLAGKKFMIVDETDTDKKFQRAVEVIQALWPV